MMDKAPTSGRYQKPSSGRRVRLIPLTPRQEPSTPTTSSSSTTDTTQSSGTSLGESQSGSPRGVMRRVRPTGEMPYPFTHQATNIGEEETIPSDPVFHESSSDVVSLPGTEATSPASSSSYNLLADTDSAGEGSNRAEGKRICKGRSVGMEQVAAGGKQADNLVEIVVIDSEEDEEEMKGSSSQTSKQGVERTRFPLEEITSEAIREMQEFDRNRTGN